MRPLADTRRVAALAARQHGNITIAQLSAFGLSRGEVRTRVEAGWLLPRHTGVFAVGHVPRSRASRWHAAVLALGPEAVLSYEAAGALFEVVRGATRVEVTVPPTSGRPHRDGIVVHRQQLPPEHVTTRDGIPCTTLVRLMLDLAAVRHGRSLANVFEQAQVKHGLSPDVLGAEVLSRPRHRGSGRLKLLLADAVDPAGVRSILELRFLRLCAQHGIPRPLVNVAIGPWTPDFLWPQQRLVVETDGVRFHATVAARRRDAEKDDWLRAAGYRVIRLRWADVVSHPDAAATKVAQALATGCSPRPSLRTWPSFTSSGTTR
jgi:hypothetical protein